MKSSHNSFQLDLIDKAQLQLLTGVREREQKLGETLVGADGIVVGQSRFLILGISEDIGPQSNLGFPGSVTAFPAFLKRFLNVQSNAFIDGDEIVILGEIRSLVAFENLDQGRSVVTELDEFVSTVLRPYLEMNMIPIVIGGGHNNAFPLIHSVAMKLGHSINVVNMDPHADFRPLEGRHSGNSFSYAHYQGWLELYAVIGLHESYNSQYILEALKSAGMFASFFDDYISGESNFDTDLKAIFKAMYQKPFGIELDMDAIAFMPSSAVSPSGFTLEQARKYLMTMAQSKSVQYLHLPEAAPRNSNEEMQVGKALAYLVADFIKVQQKLKIR